MPPLSRSLPARPESPGAGAEGSHIQDSCSGSSWYHGSLVPRTVTVPVMALLTPPALSGQELALLLSVLPAWLGSEQGDGHSSWGTGPGCEGGLLLL